MDSKKGSMKRSLGKRATVSIQKLFFDEEKPESQVWTNIVVESDDGSIIKSTRSGKQSLKISSVSLSPCGSCTAGTGAGGGGAVTGGGGDSRRPLQRRATTSGETSRPPDSNITKISADDLATVQKKKSPRIKKSPNKKRRSSQKRSESGGTVFHPSLIKPELLSYGSDGTAEKILKGATLEGLIRVALDSLPNTALMSHLVLTHHHFTTSDEVFGELLKLFEDASKLSNVTQRVYIVSRVVQSLCLWVDLNTRDFDQNVVIMEGIRQMKEDLKRKGLQSGRQEDITCGVLLNNSWQRFRRRDSSLVSSKAVLLSTIFTSPTNIPVDDNPFTTSTVTISITPTASGTSVTTHSSSTILDTPPTSSRASITTSSSTTPRVSPAPCMGEETTGSLLNSGSWNIEDLCSLHFPYKLLARQMTIFDHTRFCHVPLNEFTGCRFQKPDLSPILHTIVARFNEVTLWVGTEITKVENLKQRAKTISYFVHLAESLLKLKNFEGFLAVVFGLSQFSVSRLKKSIKAMSNERQIKLEQLQELANPMGNFHKLRELHETPPPMVKSISVLVKDLTGIEEGNKNWWDTKKKEINVEKMLLLGNVISLIIECQNIPYCLDVQPSVQEYLNSLEFISESELERLSKLIEP
eukprot:TRINITY_DN6722_c0_g1_i3.p1 TRINITY_DN6722_c0_g1~~TRINITY_DN6722_c0_g1_i3.p1  ORF type:complete len:638 (-),score=158.90 TRINITY_DN6722_c0_g1_i3:343-2256(-)